MSWTSAVAAQTSAPCTGELKAKGDAAALTGLLARGKQSEVSLGAMPLPN